MNRYVLIFSKSGYIKYTSHLDMLRLFKRMFRRSGIDLAYSQGFNPHPKMGFAQPLSLGYSAENEYLEFESETAYTQDEILSMLAEGLPEGIQILRFGKVGEGQKSLAASCYAADYEVLFPELPEGAPLDEVIRSYLEQKSIRALKRMKKTKKMEEVEIRDKIRSLRGEASGSGFRLFMKLDCGSSSNLSPELVIRSFLDHAGLRTERAEIEVNRKRMDIPVDYRIDWL